MGVRSDGEGERNGRKLRPFSSPEVPRVGRGGSRAGNLGVCAGGDMSGVRAEEVRPTRFHELGYVRLSASLWRIVTTEDLVTVGPLYRTRTELLSNLECYASFYGCETAASWVPQPG